MVIFALADREYLGIVDVLITEPFNIEIANVS